MNLLSSFFPISFIVHLFGFPLTIILFKLFIDWLIHSHVYLFIYLFIGQKHQSKEFYVEELWRDICCIYRCFHKTWSFEFSRNDNHWCRSQHQQDITITVACKKYNLNTFLGMYYSVLKTKERIVYKWFILEILAKLNIDLKKLNIKWNSFYPNTYGVTFFVGDRHEFWLDKKHLIKHAFFKYID